MKKIFLSLVLSVISLIFSFCCNTNEQTNQNSDDSLTPNTIKDIDGNTYKTVSIGKYVWMKENLKVAHYGNGDEIPNIKGDTAWMDYKKGAYCSYNNDTALARTYGYLYNWYAVNDVRNICPVGWHVANWTEFDDLNFLYGGSPMSGLFLKESGTLHWDAPNDATNESNFTALPGGTRFAGFERLGGSAFFWNREDYLGDACSEDKGCAYECSLRCGSFFLMDWGHKYRGMSVRCVKDSTDVK